MVTPYGPLLRLAIARFRALVSEELVSIEKMSHNVSEQAMDEQSACSDRTTKKLANSFYASQWENTPIETGAIVLVSVKSTPEQTFQENAEVAVLLTKKTVDAWEGYVLGGDREFSGEWDLVLEDTDQPVGPHSEIVQIWNPVNVYDFQIIRKIGELDENRVEAVNAMRCQFSSLEELTLTPKLGSIESRQVGKHLIQTGTPVMDEADPRCLYMNLYRGVGRAVNYKTIGLNKVWCSAFSLVNPLRK